MKKQVVVIHGGKTFKIYEKYINSLKKRDITIHKFKLQKEWKDSLQTELGVDFEVFTPRMPNGNNAVYQEWKIWFERLSEFLNDDVILIGHSLGGIFLAKYLSENTFPKRTKAVILLAAPFADLDAGRSLCSFTLPKSLNKFTDQVKMIYIIHSKDDPVVPFEQADKYKSVLPNSELIVFADRQHFNQESFTEIITLIKSL